MGRGKETVMRRYDINLRGDTADLLALRDVTHDLFLRRPPFARKIADKLGIVFRSIQLDETRKEGGQTNVMKLSFTAPDEARQEAIVLEFVDALKDIAQAKTERDGLSHTVVSEALRGPSILEDNNAISALRRKFPSIFKKYEKKREKPQNPKKRGYALTRKTRPSATVSYYSRLYGPGGIFAR